MKNYSIIVEQKDLSELFERTNGAFFTRKHYDNYHKKVLVSLEQHMANGQVWTMCKGIELKERVDFIYDGMNSNIAEFWIKNNIPFSFRTTDEMAFQ